MISCSFSRRGPPRLLRLLPTSETTFTIAEAPGVTFAFAGRGGLIERLTVTQGNGPAQTYPRVTDAAPSAPLRTLGTRSRTLRTPRTLSVSSPCSRGANSGAPLARIPWQ